MKKALIRSVVVALFAGSMISVTPTYSAEAIPTTIAALWQAIDKTDQELLADVKAGRLNEVHHQAYAIRDLVAALPTRSKAMSAEHQKSLAANVKFVAILAQRLDTAGDAGDRAAVDSNLEKLQSLLVKMRTAR